MKVAVLFANYGPYHLARVEQFQRRAECLGWQVVGLELARTDIIYEWEINLEHTPLQVASIFGNRKLQQVGILSTILQVCRALQEFQPRVVAISGYFLFAMIVALLWCKANRIPVVLLSESKEDDAHRNGIQEQIKSYLIRQYTSALVGGKAHQRYLKKLGMAQQAIFFGYDVVGNDIFYPEKIRALPSPLDKPYFLTVNRFVPKKNLFRVLSAYADYLKNIQSCPWDLVLCGDGPLRTQMERQIDALALQNHVHITGFLQQDELLAYFAHARCFIHASIQEQWGLVVNEAMAAGLPVLVSETCGCFEDLVIEGVNGFGFDPENVEQLTKLMVRMSSGDIELRLMGEASLAHIANYSPDYFAKGLVNAVQYALAQQ